MDSDPETTKQWSFAIDFRTARHWFVNSGADSMQVKGGPDGVVQLRSIGGGAMSDADGYSLQGHGFSDKAEAVATGKRWRDLLALASVAQGVTIDFGLRESVSGGQTTTDHLTAVEGTTSVEVPGVTVYVPDGSSFAYVVGQLSASLSDDEFRDMLDECSTLDPEFVDGTFAASTLYNASRVTNVEAVRLVLLVTAVESLCQTRELSKPAQTAIDDLKGRIKSTLPPGAERDSILGRLHEARTDSIASAYRRLLSTFLDGEYGGTDPVSFFRQQYKRRSSFVHGGTVPGHEDLVRGNEELDRLVRDVLQAIACSRTVSE